MAMDFDGNNDRIELGTWGIAGNKLSIMGWATWDGGSVTDPRIISKGPTIYFQNWCLLMNGGDKTFAFRIYNPSQKIVKSPTAATSNKRYHVCGTYDGSTMRLYIDGTQVATGAKSGNLTNDSAPVWIGGQPITVTSRPWNGTLDDIRVYSRLLSANEVETIYNCAGHDGIVDGLEGRWVLDYDTENALVSNTSFDMKDFSEKNRHGTAHTSSTYKAGELNLRRRNV